MNFSMRSIALFALPSCWKDRKNKDIYWNLFWLGNAATQVLILAALLFYYLRHPMLATSLESGPAPDTRFSISFLAAIALCLLAIFRFYRKGGINGGSVRMLYVSALVPMFFDPASGQIKLSLVTYGLMWIVVTHISAVYILRRRETVFWSALIVGSFIFAPKWSPADFFTRNFDFLVTDNLVNFVMIFGVTTLEVVILRFINEQTESEIAEANRKLEAQLEENRSLVRILVHDIANPLTTASSFLMIENRDLGGSRPRLEKASRAVDKIRAIIEDVRMIQKLRDGKTALELNRFDIRPAVEGALLVFEERIAAKKIHIETRLSELAALGNENLFSNQVVANLLSNAIKFTPENGRIRLIAESRGARVVLRVEDSGVGIPAELKARLFDVNAHTTRPGTAGEAGTGYGLPIVKTIVEKMGGEISVESRVEGPETGTVFEVSLQSA